MSFRVNLILEGERRSGGKLSAKSFMRIAGIVAPVLVALLIMQQALSGLMLRSQLDSLESQWSAVEPRQKQAVRLASRLNFNQKTKAELDAWASARPPWHRLLAAIMEAAPDTVRFTALRISQIETSTGAPPPPSPPVRVYQIVLDGRTSGVNSMQAVQTLEEDILNHPEMAPLLESVKVANFAADTESSDVWSRVFTIECRLLPLPEKEKQ